MEIRVQMLEFSALCKRPKLLVEQNFLRYANAQSYWWNSGGKLIIKLHITQ